MLRPEALAEAKEAFENRASKRYRRMAPVFGRLAEALARNGPFAVADRVLDVGIALERMYVLDEGKISRKLRNRAARYLGTDGPSQERIRESAQDFYEVRSDIVHNWLHRLTPERVHARGVLQRLRHRAEVPVQATARRAAGGLERVGERGRRRE